MAVSRKRRVNPVPATRTKTRDELTAGEYRRNRLMRVSSAKVLKESKEAMNFSNDTSDDQSNKDLDVSYSSGGSHSSSNSSDSRGRTMRKSTSDGGACKVKHKVRLEMDNKKRVVRHVNVVRNASHKYSSAMWRPIDELNAIFERESKFYEFVLLSEPQVLKYDGRIVGKLL